ncbi:hypothetical protein M9Y10_036661 [Tritrichomonas musculus]|uniref:MSP domain-containing protein n=1 Tax=Tritrichomonas musculus TaxID=1915356 RepID=A0ABR2GTG6_9EUKA
MISSMNQNNSKYQIGLNIHLLTFKLPEKLVHDSDSIRVSITSFPEENKQHFYVKGKKINTSNHVFSLNITNKTDKIVIVFRKKNAIGEDPIIASATIHLKKFTELPIEQMTSGTKMTDVKVLDIYYPLQKQIEEEQSKEQTNVTTNKHMKRKVLGQMEIQLSFSTPYLNSNKEKTNKKENKKNSKKINKICKPKKNGKYEQITDENGYMNFNLL